MLWVTVIASTALALSIGGGIALLRTRRANRIASDALARAGDANQIAKAANQISQEANAISRQALAALTEQHVVDWEPTWQRNTGTLVLRQLGADDAYQVTVIVTSKNLHEVCTAPRVAPGEELRFDLPQVAELRRQHEAAQIATQDRLSSGSSMIYFAGRFEITLQITVAWYSAAGFAKSAMFQDLRVR